MRLVVLVLLVLVAASARATPVTYEFSTYRSLLIGPLGPTGRVLRTNPCCSPGPTGRFSYDAETGVFSLSFEDSLFASSAPVVDLSDWAALNVVGDLSSLAVDFGTAPAVATPFTTDTGYTILDIQSFQLLLGAPGLFTGGALRSGLADADFTDATFAIGHQTAPGQGACTPENPSCPTPPFENTTTRWVMLGLHQVPEPSVEGLALLAALLAILQTIRPARASV